MTPLADKIHNIIAKCISEGSIEPWLRADITKGTRSRYKKSIQLIVEVAPKSVTFRQVIELHRLFSRSNRDAAKWLRLSGINTTVSDIDYKLRKVSKITNMLGLETGDNGIKATSLTKHCEVASLCSSIASFIALSQLSKMSIRNLARALLEEEIYDHFKDHYQRIAGRQGTDKQNEEQLSFLNRSYLNEHRALVATLLDIQNQETSEHRVKYISLQSTEPKVLDQICSISTEHVGHYL
ncbi:hypothetical protein ABCL16_003460 [Vibrio parahaemolyticus]